MTAHDFSRATRGQSYTATVSKVQTCVEHKLPASSRQTDAAEVGGVDVHCRIAEIRMVQNIDRIHPEFQFSGFINPHAFDEVRIKVDLSRTLNPILADVSEPSDLRVHQNKVAVGLRNRPESALALQRLT